jgi:hypothetical protein
VFFIVPCICPLSSNTKIIIRIERDMEEEIGRERREWRGKREISVKCE